MSESRLYRIRRLVENAFSPERLDVEDESERHHGHAGWREGGETHFHVRIISAAFTGKSRVERHRMINAALADEFSRGLHALSIDAKAPDE